MGIINTHVKVTGLHGAQHPGLVKINQQRTQKNTLLYEPSSVK